MASNSEGETRKLAAIMFTDVKDFSKKMGENEIAAMDVLRIHDEAMKEIVAKHNGVVIKSLGDSFMVDFSSAVNAVRCAIEAQERFHQHNIDKVEFEKIQIRIGIHLGDVMNIGNDLYGDGVNIAARIEAITEPNRICVSAEIYGQVKNKMPIRAYNMGSIDLKNIAEPVEVYELLLDSIPGLSEPSETAQSFPTRRKADIISAQVQEEATQVEAAKNKLNEAEDRENAERQARAGEHYAKAEEYFRAGDLAKAEEEIKEIYKIVQIHYEAQMLILQIEEQRAVRDEEERRRRVREEKQRKEEERKQKIQKCLDVALGFVEKEQYQDALNALQEVYTLEPNNEQAKRIEKQVQFAEEARLERQRLEALAEEERAKEEAAQLQRQKAEEQAKVTLEKVAAARKEQDKTPKIKLYVGIGAAVVLVIAIAVTYLLTRGSLKKPGTIAVLTLTTNRSDQSYIGEALSAFIAGEAARTPNAKFIDPVSARAFGSDVSSVQAQAAALGITHVLHGSVSVNGPMVSLQVQLNEIGEEKPVWESSAQAGILDLNTLASQTGTALLKALDVESTPHAAAQPGGNAEAFDLYLRGYALSLQSTPAALQHALVLFRDAVRLDSTLVPAKLALSAALLTEYQQEGKRDESALTSALLLAEEARRSNPDNAAVHAILAEAYRYKQQFVKAREEVNAGLAIQPGNARCLRELALQSLIQGNLDEALKEADEALKIDPLNYTSQSVKGIVQLYREQYEDASRLFDHASELGGPDSLLTVKYKFRVWLKLEQAVRVIAFCDQKLPQADDRTKLLLYYWKGRAFSLTGKLEDSKGSFDQGLLLADQVTTKDPKDVMSLALYGLLEARRAKNPKAAVQKVERAVMLDSTSAKLHYYKARVHAIQRDNANAISELAKAVSLQYNFSDILDPDFLSVWAEPGFKAAMTKK